MRPSFLNILLLLSSLSAQGLFTPSYPTLPIRNREQREALLRGDASEGLIVLGEEDSCLYYLRRGRWFRVCGECLPIPLPPKIDSISVGLGDLLIFWSTSAPLELGEEIEGLILPESLAFRSTLSPFYAELKVGGIHKVLLRRKGLCGYSSWVAKDSIEVPYARCPAFPLQGRTVATIGVGRTCWALEDWAGEPRLAANRHKEGGLYFSNRRLAEIQAALPPGWRLPTQKECEVLLSVINQAKHRLDKLRFERKGAYVPEDRQWIGIGEVAIYLIGDAPDKALVVNPLGGLIAPLEGKEIHARVRLVRSAE
ncbi:MAG: hypothetical protein NZZ60_03680 [Bacteroidia bacterium]|nr:hypothetical protein [Bacteroidia bacterium]